MEGIKPENKDSGKVLRAAQGIPEPDIDFIKKCVKKAEEFELLEGNISFNPCIKYKEQICIINQTEEWCLWPHLLQETIESIKGCWSMVKNNQGYSLTYYKDSNKPYFKIQCCPTPIEAKIAALKYIFEQEKSNA